MTFSKFVCSFTFLALGTGTAWSCPADLDPGFGDGGVARSNLGPEIVAGIQDSVITSDGSILLAGFVRTRGFWDPTPTVLRVTPDGDFDDTFGDGGLAQLDLQATISSIALDEDGAIVVSFDVYDEDFDNPDRAGVARFDEDGALDESFGDGGFTLLDRNGVVFARDVIVRSDGAIAVAGQERQQSFVWRAHVYFFTPGGDFEEAVEIGDAATRTATSLVEVAGGAIMVAGMYAGDLQRAQLFLARLTANGEPDSAFGDDGVRHYPAPASQDESWRIGKDAAGRLYVAGNQAPDAQRRRTRIFVRRFLGSGDLDASYGRNGRAFLTLGRRLAIRGLAVDDDGEATAAGHLINGRAALVARFTPDGRRDRTFADHGLLRVTEEFGNQLSAVNLQDDDRIVATGSTQFDALAIRLEGGDADGSEACLVGCGDGILRPWEQCDDGNVSTGDGCNAICENE